MKCVNHPEVDAVVKCIACGSSICESCRVVSKGEDYCKKCIAQQHEGVAEQKRSPALAAILSFVIGGLGQIYNGQIGKGILIFFTSWLVIPWIYGIFNAYSTAKKINEGKIVPKQTAGCLVTFIISSVLFFFFVAIIGLLAAIAIPNFLRARHNANEAAAQANLMTISSACEIYKVHNNEYPENLQDLASISPTYIDSKLASGEKQGYRYVYSRGDNGITYTCTATPLTKGVTGTRTFTIDHSGVVNAIIPEEQSNSR